MTVDASLEQRTKQIVILGFAACAVAMTYVFHSAYDFHIVFTHLFYVPIILACLWWKEKGLSVPLFLGTMLVLSDVFLRPDISPIYDGIRACMFILIGCVVCCLNRQRMKAEEVSRKKQAKYRALFENMNEGVAIYEPVNNAEDFIFLDINKAGQVMDAVETERIIGKSVADVLPAVKKLGILEVMQRVWNTGKAERHSGSCYENNRIVGWRESYIYKLPDGEIVAVYSDQTRQKQAEEEKADLQRQLQQTQKMEAIGMLAGGIAHDFNNILFAVMGYAEMAMGDLHENSPARRKLEEVLKATDRAKDLIQQILTFSRKADIEFRPMKVQSIVKEVLKLIRSSLPTTVRIRQTIDDNCASIKGDPVHIHQIMMNLCTNAYHAMRDRGGVLEVALSPIEITSEDEMSSFVKPGYYVRLSVGDTGCGIDRAIMERVFEPYFTTKEQGEGTGLGLSVVHGIVKSYGGEIRVYSEPGKGTVFHVYFPCIGDEACLLSPHSSQPLRRGTERILLIDDERQILEMERQMIQRLGYRVTSRDNSLDALETFRDNPDEFDLVITDMTMPDMTGDALAQKLLRIRPDIPVLLCTGFSDRVRNQGEAAGMGIKGFLMKPISLRELAGTMRDLLDAAEQIESEPARSGRFCPAYKEARGNLYLVN